MGDHSLSSPDLPRPSDRVMLPSGSARPEIDPVSMTKQLWVACILVPVVNGVLGTMWAWPYPAMLHQLALAGVWIFPRSLLLPIVAIGGALYLAGRGLLCWMKSAGEWKLMLSQASACTVACGLWTGSAVLVMAAYEKAQLRASEQGEVIVRSLEQFKARQGSYPSALEELVPEFVERVPGTGMIGAPEFQYEVADESADSGGFELWMERPTGGFDFPKPRLFYWPSQKYPDRIGNQRVQLVGRWADSW